MAREFMTLEQMIKTGTDLHVSISKGNSKMGLIPSVSLPAVITCKKCECNKLCYAKKISKLRKEVNEAYKRNLYILEHEPEKFWREVNAAVAVASVFRFHVSGDIYDADYFNNMVELARKNSHCEILTFTKKFEIVNKWIETNGELPPNLHIIYSGWKNLEMVNPYQMPECHVMYKDGTTTASDGAKWCSGNCTECFISKTGCWTLNKGEQIMIKQH